MFMHQIGSRVGFPVPDKRRDDSNEEEEKKVPYALFPTIDNTKYSAILVGPLSEENALLIPSTRLLWTNKGLEETKFELAESVDSDPLFTHLDPHCYASSSAHMKEEIPEELRGTPCCGLLKGLLFKGDLRKEEEIETLMARAKKETIYVESSYALRARLRKGYRLVPAGNLLVLTYDPKRAEQDTRHIRKDSATYIPNVMAVKNEIKLIALQMREVLRRNLSQDGIWITIDLSMWRKDYTAKSVLALYELGTRLFGKKFWRNCVLGRWDVVWGWGRRPGAETHVNIAREVVSRWKKKGLKRPSGKLASKLWGALQEVSHARAPRRQR